MPEQDPRRWLSTPSTLRSCPTPPYGSCRIAWYTVATLVSGSVERNASAAASAALGIAEAGAQAGALCAAWRPQTAIRTAPSRSAWPPPLITRLPAKKVAIVLSTSLSTARSTGWRRLNCEARRSPFAAWSMPLHSHHQERCAGSGALSIAALMGAGAAALRTYSLAEPAASSTAGSASPICSGR